MSILTEITALAETLAAGTGLPVYPTPGVGVIAGRAGYIYPPEVTWDEDTAQVADILALARWRVTVVVVAAGPEPSQLRQLIDDAQAVADVVPRPWRAVSLTPSVVEGAPFYQLTLER